MSQWYSLPDKLPVDASTVWVRRTYWFSTPFLATWDLETGTFTDDNDLVIPWYEIARWREQ
jgi:hypothetical protein